MIIVLSTYPPSLRGDLSKWLFEISTNVYVGTVSSKVRDKLWERVTRTCGNGKATMVFNTDNEQGFDFKTIGTDWKPIDLDGLKIMLRPLTKNKTE